MNELIRVVIVEDHQITRIGLRVILDSMGGCKVVDEAIDGASAVDKVLQSHPDVVLMDIALPGMDGIEATYQIKTRSPQTKVIMLTSHDSDKDILASLGNGAEGFCLKDIPADQLREAILHVVRGGVWLDSRIAKRFQDSKSEIQIDSDEVEALDAALLDFLCYVEQGLSNDEIAKELNLSPQELRQMMRRAVNALFLHGDAQAQPGQLRKQFAARIADANTDKASSSACFNIGEVFDNKYLIESHIGRGGMGRVYKARHIHTEKTLAIKVLLPQFTADRRVVRLFQEEARAASALDHPNAVRVYDYGSTADGQSFLVMDYIEGTTLESLLRRRVLSNREFHNIFDQVCNALIAAHAKDIIHCDIKPGNIVLLNNGKGQDVAKLIDFGLAKILPPPQASVQMQLTESFDLCGSPAYMSPEQCRGSKLDARSDLYSLGCVMYEALSGHLAAPGISPMECFSKHLEDTPQRFGELSPELNISRELENIIFGLLEKNLNLRTQTAADLKASLTKIFFDQMYEK